VGRIRTIKPEFPQSESIGRLSRDARLLFIQLWTIVDDSGRARASSRMLASLLYPYDEDAAKLMDGWLDELSLGDAIRLYSAEGNSYLEICNWLKHQKIDHASISKLPEFVESSRILARDTRSLAPDLGPRTIDLVPVPKAREASRTFPVPDWVPIPTWNAFVEMRVKIKKPMTDHAKVLAVKKLDEFRSQGFEPRIILEAAILNNWQGLYLPKGIDGQPIKPKPRAEEYVECTWDQWNGKGESNGSR
jgi:hypothetical protein